MKSDISILIVDDEQTNVRLLEMILKRAGYASVHSTTDSRAAIDIASQQHPDIVLLDLHMPGVSGLDVMRELATQRDWTPPFIVMLTGDASAAAKTQAFTSGAKDFIAKPFEADEIVLRIRNLAAQPAVYDVHLKAFTIRSWKRKSWHERASSSRRASTSSTGSAWPRNSATTRPAAIRAASQRLRPRWRAHWESAPTMPSP